MTRLVAKIVQVRYTYLAPVSSSMFCFAGAFAATGNTKELIICAGILIFSYILTVLDIDNTPLMLGMILEDIMEQNFVTASMEPRPPLQHLPHPPHLRCHPHHHRRSAGLHDPGQPPCGQAECKTGS